MSDDNDLLCNTLIPVNDANFTTAVYTKFMVAFTLVNHHTVNFMNVTHSHTSYTNLVQEQISGHHSKVHYSLYRTIYPLFALAPPYIPCLLTFCTSSRSAAPSSSLGRKLTQLQVAFMYLTPSLHSVDTTAVSQPSSRTTGKIGF